MRALAAPPTADALHLAIEPRVEELARVRAAVRPWLPLVAMGPAAGADALVVITELGALAIESTEDDRPVEIRLRHTHSILVAEVDVHVSPDTAAALATRLIEEGRGVDGAGVIHLLADRVHADAGPSRITLAGTIRFDDPTRTARH